jgi:hypothetical protein
MLACLAPIPVTYLLKNAKAHFDEIMVFRISRARHRFLWFHRPSLSVKYIDDIKLLEKIRWNSFFSPEILRHSIFCLGRTSPFHGRHSIAESNRAVQTKMTARGKLRLKSPIRHREADSAAAGSFTTSVYSGTT